MDDVREFFLGIGRLLGLTPKVQLSEFQRKKLLHEFNTFYDTNKDGKLEWKDFEMARESMCKMNGWPPDSSKYKFVQELFLQLWRQLQDDADHDFDGTITSEEWLKMWTKIQATEEEKARKSKGKEEEHVPAWLDKYIQYRFHLYDRTGDGEIDVDEFEYVLSMYNISPKDCRAAFIIFSENKERKVDLAYFRELALEYYRSNDPGALGNFINGKLIFE